MSGSGKLGFDALNTALKAAGEETRLRVLALLGEAELTVSDLTDILRQSQPRISRHLKLLVEAGLVERFREGTWAFFRLAEHGGGADVARALSSASIPATRPSRVTANDCPRCGRRVPQRRRLISVPTPREWDRIRKLHVADEAVEDAIRAALSDKPFRSLLDLGTGTGRMLELFGPDIERGLGLDLSLDMLLLARDRLERAGLRNCSVRQGDIYDLPLANDSFDVVIVHQVLHFLDDGARAIREAARVLRPGGRLLVVDFAPHEQEFLREQFAHRRLGFAPDTVMQWITASGLDPVMHKSLAPEPGSEGKIAVSLWLAREHARIDGDAAAARGGVMNSPVRLSRFTRGDKRRIGVSFEFFPPNTEEMDKILWESIERLAPLTPDFVSVTYGAGGTTRERTHATVKRILAETPLTPAAHLTCVASTCDDINAIVRNYHAAGVRHLVALRGDPVGGAGERYAPHPGGYQNAADLVGGIRRIAPDFEISVSAYPEKHPDSPTVEADIDMLKAKVDAGATRAITQFFFENDLYFRYLDRVRARGIDIPIVPGILPVQNFKATTGFAKRCGASVPAWIAERFQGLDNDAATRKLIAAAVAAEQVFDLVDRGVTTFHFYTMNRADLVFAICHLLGLRPAVQTVN